MKSPVSLRTIRRTTTGAFLSILLAVSSLPAQMVPAPDRPDGEGEGPFERLIIRGATLIDGTGSPARGPVDIVVEGNRITRIANVGVPMIDIDPDERPEGATREIDASGKYVMPGFVDLHLHTGGVPKAPEAEYTYKLWMAHGITTGRGVEFGSVDFSLSEKARANANEITAPRMWVYQRPGQGWDQGRVQNADQARAWVRWASENGIDGIKLVAYPPDIMEALIDEAKLHGMGTVAHLGQTGVARMNAIDAALLGLGTITHYYGLFEAIYDDGDVQDWPADMNYNDEQWRFSQVARNWNKIHPQGSDEWNALLEELLALDVTMDPTMTAYLASRDVMRARTADWHQRYTLPSQWDYYEPSRVNHGSYYYDWTSADEIAWKNFYRVWMAMIDDYKDMGGRVTVSSDAGFIYNLYGFSTIEEMELLQEAGFSPLEVLRSASLHGAETLTMPLGQMPDFGIIREGFLADMVISEENPLHNLKVLYGTGVDVHADGRVVHRGGVKYTIKDGIVFDAPALLAEVRAMVRRAKEPGAAEATH